MPGMITKPFDSPDEVRNPARQKVEVVRLGTHTAARITFQPGWRWSESVKPIVGTASCQVRHFGMLESGRLHVVHEDGSEGDAVPGEAYVIEPGHDAWVVGDVPVVGYEFESAATYAKA